MEIGVQNGDCFLHIRAKRKVGVDPRFIIPKETKRKLLFKNYNFFNKYVSLPSDDFFKQYNSKFDIVFVDGLHTYEQSLRDIENSLSRLEPGGVVIVHDCMPMTEGAAYPANSHLEAIQAGVLNEHHEWNGDVFKSIIALRSKYNPLAKSLKVMVLDCDYGLGIIRKEPNNELIDVKIEDIKNMSYSYFFERREALLNLKPVSYFNELLSTF